MYIPVVIISYAVILQIIENYYLYLDEYNDKELALSKQKHNLRGGGVIIHGYFWWLIPTNACTKQLSSFLLKQNRNQLVDVSYKNVY